MHKSLFLSLPLVVIACASTTPPAAPPTASVPSAEPGSPGEPGPPVTSSPEQVGGGTTLPPTTWRTVDQGVSVPDDWRTCSADADCSLALTTCCDQCNGGKAVAVAATHVKDVAAKFPKQCQNVACTERGCMTRAACAEGRCVMQWESAAP